MEVVLRLVHGPAPKFPRRAQLNVLVVDHDHGRHLGGSFKDAGRKSDYTVTQIQVAPDGDAAIQSLIQKSTETFGPSAPSHPTA